MAGTNEYAKIASGASADVEDIANWLAESGILSDGFPTGIVNQLQYNRAWRQATTAMALMGLHMAQVLNDDILDDPTSSLAALWAQHWVTQLLQGSFVDFGSANAYLTVNPPGITFPAPANGVRVTLFITNPNTGACTYNHMGTGAVPIKRMDGSDPSAGEVADIIELVYSVNWHIISSSPAIVRGTSFGHNVDTLTVGSGNYTVPAGVFLIQPVLIGGGGGSSGSNSPPPNGAIAGAGGGGCCIAPPIVTAPGTVYSYVVGAGGTAAIYGATGGNGGTTSFASGAYSATGGTGSSYASIGSGGGGSGGLFNLQGDCGEAFGTPTGGKGGSGAGPYGSGGGGTGVGIAADGGFPGGGAGGPGDNSAQAGKVGGNGVIYILR